MKNLDLSAIKLPSSSLFVYKSDNYSIAKKIEFFISYTLFEQIRGNGKPINIEKKLSECGLDELDLAIVISDIEEALNVALEGMYLLNTDQKINTWINTVKNDFWSIKGLDSLMENKLTE